MQMKRALVGVVAVLAMACDRGPIPKGGTASGAELYQLCGQCHGVDGSGNQSVNAPAIAGMSEWYVKAQLEKFKSGARGTHVDDFTGMQMRPMAVSLKTDTDIATISAYVAAMRPIKPVATISGGNVEKGKKLYEPCAACHGADGSGNEALKGPPLKVANDWYLVSQIDKFKTGQRGADPNDTQGALMRAATGAFTDEQTVKDIVAYIGTLQ